VAVRATVGPATLALPAAPVAPRLAPRPRRAAGFSVLKSPDIPSVLLELGFLSSERDLTNLRDGAWRDRMARGIRNALQAWRIADAAAAELVRQ